MIRVNSNGVMLGAALAIDKLDSPLLGRAVRLTETGRPAVSSLPCGRLRTVGLNSAYIVRDVVARRRPRDVSRTGRVGAFVVVVHAAAVVCSAAVVDDGAVAAPPPFRKAGDMVCKYGPAGA